MNEYIPHEIPKPKDRIIRKVYTPKEVVKIINDTYHFLADMDLTYSEKALLRDAFNTLVWEFKDD